MIHPRILLSCVVLGTLACDAPGPARSAVLETYADIARASYQDSLASASALSDAVDAFVAAPSEASLEQARDAWLASREPYGQTEVFRFYGGPIEQGDPERE